MWWDLKVCGKNRTRRLCIFSMNFWNSFYFLPPLLPFIHLFSLCTVYSTINLSIGQLTEACFIFTCFIFETEKFPEVGLKIFLIKHNWFKCSRKSPEMHRHACSGVSACVLWDRRKYQSGRWQDTQFIQHPERTKTHLIFGLHWGPPWLLQLPKGNLTFPS